VELVKSGIPELDRLLGGGFIKGKAYLLESVTGAKPRFLISAFCKQGYQDEELCKIDSFDYSYSEVLEDLKNSGFYTEKAASENKLLILDFAEDLICGSKVSGPFLTTRSQEVDMQRYENLRNVAWEEVTRLKARTKGLRVIVHSLTSLIRNFGLQDAIRFSIAQTAFLKRQGGVLLSTLNPETVSPSDLAIIEETFDGIIELTINEEKLKFQRYIRVKDSPIPLFRQEKLPYEIVGTEEGISVGAKIAEDFESFKANIRMTSPGVIDILGDRCHIQSVAALANLHELLFEVLGYEKGFDLMYQVGMKSAESMIKPYLDKFKIDISSPAFSFTDLVDAFISYPVMRGYGGFELVEFDQERKVIRFKLTNSPVARHLAGYGKPVDAYIAGSVAGGARISLGGNVVCRETLCEAKGDDHCEFEASVEYPASI
jgi:KaiC/GvpD/RAD55 family RecA-like ATPase/predicted hydrocarbon binding protein